MHKNGKNIHRAQNSGYIDNFLLDCLSLIRLWELDGGCYVGTLPIISMVQSHVNATVNSLIAPMSECNCYFI